jgi:3-oxoadipate enol-lactonase
MAELGYERRLRESVERVGGGWELAHLPRAGGLARTVRISPAGEPRGVVVVAHGAGNDALFGFASLFRQLLRGGLEIFTLDIDGHGRDSSTLLSPDHIGDCLPDAVRWSGARERRLPLHLLGVSFGGALALHAAAEIAPHSVTLIATPLRIRPGVRAVLREVGRASVRTLWRERRDYGIAGLVPAFGSFRRSLYPLRLAPDGRHSGYLRRLDSLLAGMRLEDVATTVRAPTLLVYGARDLTAPPADGERISRGIPGEVELRILPGETHLSTPLAPAALDAAANWIDDHGSHRGSGAAPSSIEQR